MVEKWLLRVQQVMIKSLCDVTAESVNDYVVKSRDQWVLDWPGQIVISVSTIYWTQEVTSAITNGTLKVSEREYMYMCAVCTLCINMYRVATVYVLYMFIVALILLCVH